ncbi:MAG: tRNA uridine-5-carboxymethylaminomethyl(34) synthesis GTPase MnmE [Synergistes sp.]|nr:tRNA uridine-5-carboxymethylaminomethyl(34) synthesis GTPase MnmE [Synergistes sp.]
MKEDIITAAATAWGYGGIAIVRLSGEGCVSLAEKIILSKRTFHTQPPRYMSLVTLCGRDGEPFDEALAVRFERGGSYTGEESAEIQCHGGLLAAQRCVEELCAFGARLAEPGEFTRRAFVNGRINLAQAEAVAGIIKAESDEALSASARSLQNHFTDEIKSLMQRMTELSAALEVDLDFPEEGEGFIAHSARAERLKSLVNECRALKERCRCGMLLRDGVRAAIIGAPNVGKSSLLNALLAKNRAIVTSIPGTTRDSIEETFIYKGMPVRITDTAGIRETNDEIEAIGVRRSLKSMKEADIILRVVDTSADMPNADAISSDNKRTIIVMNKCDLPAKFTECDARRIFGCDNVISISAATGEGIDELKKMIFALSTSDGDITNGYSVTLRQLECITNAENALTAALESVSYDMGDDIAVSCVFEAVSSLASLLGADASEEILDKIFGTFCVGK